MRDLIPGFGDQKTRDRLDELFNRQTLGSVLFGGHVNKLFERIYNLIALVIVLTLLGVDVWKSIAVAAFLFVLWLTGTILVVYVFVKWERVQKAVEDAAEKANDVASAEE